MTAGTMYNGCKDYNEYSLKYPDEARARVLGALTEASKPTPAATESTRPKPREFDNKLAGAALNCLRQNKGNVEAAYVAFMEETGDRTEDVTDTAWEWALNLYNKQREAGARLRLVAGRADDPFADLETVEKIDVYLPHTDDKGKNESTILNLRAILTAYGLGIKYNVVTREYVVFRDGKVVLGAGLNRFILRVESLAARYKIKREVVGEFVREIGNENSFNPVVDWAMGRKWDGVSRIKELCDSLVCDESIRPEFKDILIIKWLVSAWAAVSRKEGDDFRMRGILVLQSPQSMGKTTWLRCLVGVGYGGDLGWFGEGYGIDVGNRDSVFKALSCWIVELGEMERINSYGLPGLKAFITSGSHSLRRPYARAEETIWTRTVFAGTVNQKDVLIDTTGNSRFWCLPIVEIKDISNIDIQQLWAEVATMKDAGAIWWLTKTEEEELNKNNKQFEVTHPVDELLAVKVDWDTPEAIWHDRSCAELLREVGFTNPTTSDCRRASAFIRERATARPKNTHGVTIYRVPPLKVVA